MMATSIVGLPPNGLLIIVSGCNVPIADPEKVQNAEFSGFLLGCLSRSSLTLLSTSNSSELHG